MTETSELDVLYFLRLMSDYLKGSLSVHEYQRAMFDSSKKRWKLTEEQSRIVQTAYGDVDDFDSDVRLAHTIQEPALRIRVCKSLEDLRSLADTH
ncbi:hypothetical protein P8935_15115 [Telmatobacter sp. DSM 110680]|uniref:Uncharacterized protein n=1 Tax=Telmatobacter sp. DSM 110680 TaxID=3036704 RepID=A0AAU7DEU1_9BACT